MILKDITTSIVYDLGIIYNAIWLFFLFDYIYISEVTYGPQYVCPNCGELFDGRECENCHYVENK